LLNKSKKESGILTGAVGLITEAHQAEEIISSGKADLVLFARESFKTYLALTLLDLNEDVLAKTVRTR
jgi:2,4-dienoyl-CoA reductase-like NADH-dependent reductase (Old Yellow Enzyme family)